MEIKEIFKKFSSLITSIYIFVVLFVLYTGYRTFIASGYYFILVIGIVLTIPLLIYFLNEKRKIKQKNKQFDNEREKFIKNARAVKVNLDNIEIKSNKWNEKIVVDNSRYGGYNQMAGYADKNIESVDRTINTVKIDFPINGKNITTQFNIEMNTDRLRIKFAMKNETIYYYDINNPEMDFLDLDFLFEKN